MESLDALKVDRASALNDVVVLQASVTELQMTHEDLQQKFNETNAALEETRGKLDEVTGEKDILESSRSQQEEEVSGQHKDQETTKQQLEEELARAKVTWEESFKVINAKLDDTTLKHEEAESRASNISAQLASLEAEYALVAGKRDTAYSQHQTAAEERDTLQRNLDAAEESLKDLQEKLVTLKVVSDNRNQESLEEWDQRHHKLEPESKREFQQTYSTITTVGLVFCHTIVQPCFFSLQWQNSLRLILAFLLEAVFGLFLFFGFFLSCVLALLLFNMITLD